MPPPPIPPPRISGFTSTTEQPLYWCAYGSAPDEGDPGRAVERLLILHGGPGAHHDYLLPQMLRLAQPPNGARRELVFYDQRGGGRSRSDHAAASPPITWHTHVQDLERVVAELSLTPLVLVGYSWGGLLALLYFCEGARQRVTPLPSSMVLVDPAPVTRRYRERFEQEFAKRQASPEVQAMRDELAASGLRESDPAAYRHRAFELSVAGYFADPRKARDLTPFRVTGRVQQSVWQSLGDFDLLADGCLRDIRSPALVLHGRQDPIPLESSAECARTLGAELVVLQQCGHVPYVEQPDVFFGAIEQFLSGS